MMLGGITYMHLYMYMHTANMLVINVSDSRHTLQETRQDLLRI